MNRKEAAKQAREAQLKQAGGDPEKLRQLRSEWGRKGGQKKGIMKGFATDPKRAAQAAKLSHQVQRMKKRENV